MDGSWWRVLTKCGPLEKGIANHFSILALIRKEAKGKGEKQRYTHLNAEFQRIARRDKKASLSDQCEEIEENNRWGKTRDLFKKIRDIKRLFHVNMGTKKDRNGVDLTETDMQMTPPLWQKVKRNKRAS